jgi:hypothetical protein
MITHFAEEIEMMRKRWNVVVVAPSMALQV